MRHLNLSLDAGAIVTGVNTRVPQQIVHQAALALRQLLDADVSPEDPRCRALLQLVNSARLLILPTSNNGAKVAHDLNSRAAHIDCSTATVAAIMGLKNTSLLTPVASNEIRAMQPGSKVPSTSAPQRLSLKVLPKPAQKATDALIQLVRADTDLGARARNETLLKSSSFAHKMHKLRAGQRHASVRKRRLMGDSSDDLSSTREDMLPPPPPPAVPAQPPSTHAFSRTPVPAPLPFQRFILPRRRNLVYSSPVPLPMRNVPPPPTPPAPTPHVSHNVLPVPIAQEAPHPPNLHQSQGIPSAMLPPNQGDQPRPFSRFRPREEYSSRFIAAAPAMSNLVEPLIPVNDASSPERDEMDVIMHTLNSKYRSPQTAFNNSSKIRSILAERERILYRLLRRRQAELAAMPLGMTEQTRRKAIIEAKQLSLLDLQRIARFRVCGEMKKMYSPVIQEDGVVPTDHLTRLFRRQDPPIYSYTEGCPRITPFDGINELPSRPPAVVAQDSIRLAHADLSRMDMQRQKRNRRYQAKLQAHVENFQNASAFARNCRARIWKGLERHFLEKKRLEEKKKKLERMERLRLLRSNDEQAYLRLLNDTKNERLLQLVRQTDNYLMQIGAQVEKTRDVVNESSLEKSDNMFSQELGMRQQVPIEAMRKRRDMYYTVTHSVQEEVKQPSIMGHGELKSYQLEGLKWMVSLYNNNLNGILADEMGLGKTIQTIALITYLVDAKKNPGPYLIIVPLSTMGNWVRELDLWAPSLKKVAYRGDRHTRRAIQQKQMSDGDFNVLLTTYEFTVKDQLVLSRIRWQYIIIDEGHRMKNANCKLAMTLGVRYKSRNRLLLTGTPLQNNLTELWALLNFLLPTIFASADTFETWFKQPFESTTLGDTAELEEEETLLIINRLHQVLRPFLLRRLKTDVESQLPEKVEHVIRCDMSSWQRVLYRQVQSRIGLATGGHNTSVKSYNNLLMQSKKICNHPYLFYDAEAILDLPQDHLVRASGKFFLLQHMLPKFRIHGHRTLIFSQMTAALDYLEDFLVAIGIQYIRLDGNTRADDRQNLLNRFNEKDSPYFCFLLSTRAGGVGLNLQSADTVIIFDSDWNPMMDLQAQDRAHRIGQTKEVRVYRLICSGTVEVKILEQANRKLQIDAQVIQAGQFNNKSTESDRHQMLKDILRQKTDDGDEVGVVPDMEELNRLFARSDEEFEEFTRYDEQCRETGALRPLFAKDSELPEWVLQPEMDYKTEEEKAKEILLSHGRGRRRRNTTQGVDFTDAEWLKVMEGDLTYDEVLERRKVRNARRSLKTAGRNRTESSDTGSASTSKKDLKIETASVNRGAVMPSRADSGRGSSAAASSSDATGEVEEKSEMRNGMVTSQNGRKRRRGGDAASKAESQETQRREQSSEVELSVATGQEEGIGDLGFPVKLRLRKGHAQVEDSGHNEMMDPDSGNQTDHTRQMNGTMSFSRERKRRRLLERENVDGDSSGPEKGRKRSRRDEGGRDLTGGEERVILKLRLRRTANGI